VENLVKAEDSELIQNSASKELQVFNALYHKYKSSVFSFACYLTQNRGEAEDLFQETWLRVVKNLSRITNMRTFKSWILTIATNLHRDALRKKRIRRLFFWQKTAASGMQQEIFAIMPENAFSSRSNEMEHVDMGRAISKAMANLPERQRLVFVLKEIEGFKHSEISEVLKLPEGTVKTLMYRAIRRLQRDLVAYKPK
jgi:RNA polymerase sigma-70 factor (ECF subfamily)